jgi:hypothetical protein
MEAVASTPLRAAPMAARASGKGVPARKAPPPRASAAGTSASSMVRSPGLPSPQPTDRGDTRGEGLGPDLRVQVGGGFQHAHGAQQKHGVERAGGAAQDTAQGCGQGHQRGCRMREVVLRQAGDDGGGATRQTDAEVAVPHHLIHGCELRFGLGQGNANGAQHGLKDRRGSANRHIRRGRHAQSLQGLGRMAGDPGRRAGRRIQPGEPSVIKREEREGIRCICRSYRRSEEARSPLGCSGSGSIEARRPG